MSPQDDAIILIMGHIDNGKADLITLLPLPSLEFGVYPPVEENFERDTTNIDYY